MRESNKQNELCFCHNKCISCFNLNPLNPDMLLHYIPVSSKSKGCDLDFYKPFTHLDQIELGSMKKKKNNFLFYNFSCIFLNIYSFSISKSKFVINQNNKYTNDTGIFTTRLSKYKFK
jgi:hypothetical protein